MTKVSEKNKKEFQRNKENINIKEFMLLKSGEQDKLLEETLNKVYEGNVEFNKKYIDKILNVAFDNKDNEVYLPHSLCVQKDGNKLIFSFKKNNKVLVILFLLGFLFISGFATFTGIQILGTEKMNIDINDDGIPDINIDINDDGICEVNCTNNFTSNLKDLKPEFNIDHGTMRTPLFNVKRVDENGNEYIFNKMNQKDEEGRCYLNCDTNDDGWPETNIDLDGDGKADINIDTNYDGIPDLNIDTNGDGVADINLDTDGDGKCDKLCSYVVNKSGQATQNTGVVDVDTAALIVTFKTGSDVKISNLYPDDQTDEGVNKTIKDIEFSIQNTTDAALYYNLNWIEIENTFQTDNFWTKIVSTNGGYNTYSTSDNWVVAPKTNSLVKTNVLIPAKTTQNYTVSFVLHGTGEPQNIDQGKIFKGRIQVELIEDNDN